MRYVDYIGNVSRLAVELVNAGSGDSANSIDATDSIDSADSAGSADQDGRTGSGGLTDLAGPAGSDSGLSERSRAMFDQHGIRIPDASEFAPLLVLLGAAVGAAADGTPLEPVNELLARYPPLLHVSDHDGQGGPHLHFAPDHEEPIAWIGRSCAAALAHVICGDPDVTLGRCKADGCRRYFIDQSRNRSRRFCSNACASRTTVAAHRARRKSSHRLAQ